MYVSQNKYEQFVLKWSELYDNLWSSVPVIRIVFLLSSRDSEYMAYAYMYVNCMWLCET